MTLAGLRQWIRRVMFAYHRDEAAGHLKLADLHQTLAARWAASMKRISHKGRIS